MSFKCCTHDHEQQLYALGVSGADFIALDDALAGHQGKGLGFDPSIILKIIALVQQYGPTIVAAIIEIINLLPKKE